MLGCSHYGELRNKTKKTGIDNYLTKFTLKLKVQNIHIFVSK
jgi:hypothetical protein